MNHQDRWFGVELRHLAALAAVARERSFRGAADSLGYVQSAVSQQIAQLEKLVGVRLVKRARGSKDIGLTPEGELLLGHAGEILTRMHAAQADLNSHVNPSLEKTLKVGVFPSVAVGLLPSIIRRVAHKDPELQLEIVESASDAASFRLVADGELDVAFGEWPLEPGPFGSRRIISDPCLLLVPSGSELAEREDPPSVEELATTRLIAVDGTRHTAFLELWFAGQGHILDFALRADSEATVRAYVAAGLGSAIVPRLGFERWDDRIVAVELQDVVPKRPLALYWHNERQHGPALETFCSAAVQTARDIANRRRTEAWTVAPPVMRAAA